MHFFFNLFFNFTKESDLDKLVLIYENAKHSNNLPVESGQRQSLFIDRYRLITDSHYADQTLFRKCC